MKSLSDDKKEQIFDDIVKSISHIHNLAPGEFTAQTITDALREQGKSISINKVRHRLRTLHDADVLGKRDITSHGARAVAYYPLREVSYDEIIEILLEA